MVLESLINLKNAEEHPWKMFFIGFLYAAVSVALALYIWPANASLVSILLIVIATIPLIHKTLKSQEEIDINSNSEKKDLIEHAKSIKFLLYLFLGFVTLFTLCYLILPSGTVSTLFSEQIGKINEINPGHISLTGNTYDKDFFFKILINNINVLVFCIIFSFFYGSGALFILTWNASVISVAIGNAIKKNLASATALHYTPLIFHGIMKYMTHGIFEITAFFIAGLAGGIVSVAIIKHDAKKPVFKKVLKDMILLIIIAITILFFAALIETYVTPKIFT